MHYAHRSNYIAHRASVIVCKGIHEAMAMSINRIVTIGTSSVCSDRLQSKAPDKSKACQCVNRPQPRHICQTPSRQYPIPAPRKIDATVIHTRELTSCGIESSRRTPQKWEDMVMRMQSLEAKIGGDFELRASNCW